MFTWAECPFTSATLPRSSTCCNYLVYSLSSLMQTNRLATLTLGTRPSKAAADSYRLELEERLHAHLDKRCLVVRKGRQIFVDIPGDFTEPQLDHLARGVQRVWEWEAA